MLLTRQTSEKRTVKTVLKYAFTGLAFLGLVYFFLIPLLVKKQSLQNPDIILCDAEKTWRGQYLSNGRLFKSVKSQSDEEAFNGRYSAKLAKGEGLQFGLSYDWTDFVPGKSYLASVWVKKKKAAVNATLVLASPNDSDLYFSNAEANSQSKGAWKQIRLIVQIPKNYAQKVLRLYVFTDGKEIAYFDDLRLESLPGGVQTANFEPRQLAIRLKDKSYRQIKSLRDEAIKQGLIITHEDSWVKGQLIENEEIIPVKLRLKGDWLDHLRGDKWSFRLKVKDPYAWNRLITFSLQTPEARYYALEWLLHRFWTTEDILTTRYDFVQLSLNGKPLGAYAYEEHFEKHLLEYKQRREGPILRFSEEALWEVRIQQINQGAINDFKRPAVADMEQAGIGAFQEDKLLENPALRAQFEQARDLMYQYQQGLKTAKEIFDLPRMGRYYAIADIMGAYHGYVWHNQRFYYNPVSGKLEPIGYDGYSGRPRKDPLALGKAMIENGPPEDVVAMRRLFDDEDFIEEYMQALFRLTTDDYLNQFLDQEWLGLSERIQFLKGEFPKMKIERQRILSRARQLRRKLMPFSAHSVQAKWKSQDSGSRQLELSNIHELPLQVVGWSTKADLSPSPFSKPINLGPLRMGYPRPVRLVEAPQSAQYIFYRPFGVDTLFSSPIQQWVDAGVKDIAVQQLLAKGPLLKKAYCEVVGQKILFKKGQHQINEWIVIPPNYEVYFEAGAELDFRKGSGFLSQSPVHLNGTKEAPVIIRSGDQQGAGFTVLEAGKASGMDYAIFDGLSNLQYKSWNLTGAVCFYESTIRMSHCVIKNNQCEDALNIIRSRFSIDNIQIKNTLYDGFDADFCTGELVDSQIEQTGNDGLDFSGSQITIKDCQLKQCGDKGISIGEESKVEIEGVSIDGATIGIASKDLSYARVNSVDLKNCNQGFAAYQKKPEYGHSTIFVRRYSAKNVKYLHTIAPRCTLELKGQLIIGE